MATADSSFSIQTNKKLQRPAVQQASTQQQTNKVSWHHGGSIYQLKRQIFYSGVGREPKSWAERDWSLDIHKVARNGMMLPPLCLMCGWCSMFMMMAKKLNFSLTGSTADFRLQLLQLPPHCSEFSSAATALAFKLSTVITRALHFNKSVINVILPRDLSQWLTAVLTLCTSSTAHTHRVGGLTYNNAILKMSAAPFNFIGLKASG